MNHKLYPVLRLNDSITQLMNELQDNTIHNSIMDGLSAEIELFDEDCGITDIACFRHDDRFSINKVWISAAYLQMLWIICYISIKIVDMHILQEEIKGTEIEQNPNEYYKQALKLYNNAKVREKIKALLEIFDEEKVMKETCDAFQLADFLITQGRKKVDISLFNSLDMDSFYGQKANGVYCYAVIFVLLHEKAHFDLHRNKEEQVKKDEEEADAESFWNIFLGVNEDSKKSAYLGITAALFSFFLFSEVPSSDGVHPREDIRLFDKFDNIKEEYQSSSLVLTTLFQIWAFKYGKEEIFDIVSSSNDDDEALNRIKDYLGKQGIIS